MVDAMIFLHESTATEFSTNGIGSLSDAVTCIVTEERNGEYELEMTYPITGQKYEEIELRKIITAKPNPYDDRQPFRIYYISKPIDGIVTINAEHISYDLTGYPVEPFSATTAPDALIAMKDACPVTCPFTFSTDKTTEADMDVEKPSSMRSLLGGVEGSILDVYGGEYEFDEFDVILHNQRGEDRGVTIRYGKNLTDLEQEENCSSVYTGVYPFWYSENDGLVQLSDPIVYVDGTFDFTWIYPLDLSQYFDEAPSESELQEQAETYISNNDIGVPTVSLTVSFVQLADSEEYQDYALLEKVYLCDTVTVEFESLGVSSTAKCITTKYDVLTGKYTEIELGESKTNLSTTLSSQNTAISETITQSYMEKAIANATSLITGGQGGYVVIRSSTGGSTPDEILIMDTDDITTATKVWRWNKNGLGYSSTGYEGNFTLAMTADGAIVADFITVGTLRGTLIDNADQITSAVHTGNVSSYITQYYDNVRVAFNNSSKYVQISAGAIEIYNGSVTDDELRATFTEVGEKFYRDGYYVGLIGTTSWTDNTSHKGLLLGLEYTGKFMTFGRKTSSSASSYTTMLTFSAADSIYDEYGIHFGANVYAHGVGLYDVDLCGSIEADGYSVTDGKRVPIITAITDNGDGTITWTTSSFTVRNGMITSVPSASTSI